MLLSPARPDRPTNLPLQLPPRKPLVLRETDALTVKASTEKREAKWLKFSQKSGVGQSGRQETKCGTCASRAAPGAFEKRRKEFAVGGWWQFRI